MPTWTARRTILLGGLAALACSRAERRADGATTTVPSRVRLLEWDLGTFSWGRGRATVVVPAWEEAGARRFPLLVALHGRGESLKTPEEGAFGWPRDYAMLHAYDRLLSPPLNEADYEGIVDVSRMATQNASLARQPFGGLVVACPWVPDVRPAATGDIAEYTRFLLDVLIPRVRKQTAALDAPEATGIDGVSLGGAIALRIGLSRPDAFGAVGGIQPAISEGQNADWTMLAQRARAQRPTLLLRLLTSREDTFRSAVSGLSRAWQAAGVVHDFVEVPGPHDYIFNRGPGSIELLLWHDRALRG
jgi:iron(III)-salmochelin esterase